MQKIHVDSLAQRYLIAAYLAHAGLKFVIRNDTIVVYNATHQAITEVMQNVKFFRFPL